MAPNIQEQHAIETYKSLIQIFIEGMKLLILLNGGAAVALLAYLGNISGKASGMLDMRIPMWLFLAGLCLCALCIVAAYLTQLALFNEAMGRPSKSPLLKHSFWLLLAILLVLSSVGLFAYGSYEAVLRFR